MINAFFPKTTRPGIAQVFGDMLVTIEGNSIGDAAMAEIGRRETRDEEGSVKMVHSKSVC